MAVFKRDLRRLRQQTQIDAWLTLEGGFAKRGCTVLDVSSTGARLRLLNNEQLGGKICVAFDKDVRKLTPCRMIWQKGKDIGVEFVAAA